MAMVPTLMDRMKKPAGNKVPPGGQPPAMPQMGAPPAANPGQPPATPKAPNTNIGKAKQPKTNPAAATPGVNAKMNNAPAKNGRPPKLAKSLASGDPTQPSNRVTPVQNPATKRITPVQAHPLPETPIPPTPVKKEINIIDYLKLMTKNSNTLQKAMPEGEAPQAMPMKAKKPKVKKPEQPEMPKIGVKDQYQPTPQMNLVHFLTNLANPGSQIINRVTSAAKHAIKPDMAKSAAHGNIHNMAVNIAKRRSGTKVVVNPDIDTNTAVKAPTEEQLRSDYNKEVEARHDPKLKAKREKVMSQTQTALAYKNKNSPDPGIKQFGQAQWRERSAKERLHFHIKGAIDKTKAKFRG